MVLPLCACKRHLIMSILTPTSRARPSNAKASLLLPAMSHALSAELKAAVTDGMLVRKKPLFASIILSNTFNASCQRPL